MRKTCRMSILYTVRHKKNKNNNWKGNCDYRQILSNLHQVKTLFVVHNVLSQDAEYWAIQWLFIYVYLNSKTKKVRRKRILAFWAAQTPSPSRWLFQYKLSPSSRWQKKEKEEKEGQQIRLMHATQKERKLQTVSCFLTYVLVLKHYIIFIL